MLEPEYQRPPAPSTGEAAPRDEILGRYSVVATPDEAIATYRPLIDDLGADIVTFQMTCPDQPLLISILGNDVLPRLRTRGPSRVTPPG